MILRVIKQVLLANEDFEGALNLLDQSHSEAIQVDVQLFNTILREAYIKVFLWHAQFFSSSF